MSLPGSDELGVYYDAKRASYGQAPTADNAHAKIPALVGHGQTVLDVGCGRGHLGADLKKLDNIVVGLELSKTAAAEARQRLDEVYVGSVEQLDELPLEEGSFDVVVAADILEHLFDPGAALARLRRYLRPGGKLVASVPNVAHFSLRLQLLTGRWEYQDIGLLDHGHIRFFTRRTAEQLLVESGYALESMDTALSIPDAPPWMRRVIDLLAKLSSERRREWAEWIAAQLIFVARAPS